MGSTTFKSGNASLIAAGLTHGLAGVGVTAYRSVAEDISYGPAALLAGALPSFFYMAAILMLVHGIRPTDRHALRDYAILAGALAYECQQLVGNGVFDWLDIVALIAGFVYAQLWSRALYKLPGKKAEFPVYTE